MHKGQRSINERSSQKLKERARKELPSRKCLLPRVLSALLSSVVGGGESPADDDDAIKSERRSSGSKSRSDVSLAYTGEGQSFVVFILLLRPTSKAFAASKGQIRLVKAAPRRLGSLWDS